MNILSPGGKQLHQSHFKYFGSVITGGSAQKGDVRQGVPEVFTCH
jgi:hypothetical protein